MNRLLCPTLLFLGSLAGAAERPNLLVLVSDDQQRDTIAALGNPIIQTPHLDRLVRSGTAFTRAYCMGSTQPAVCVPSRAMFLSGRSLFRVPANLPADVPLWPEVFAHAGYVSYGVGKWHNGPASYARAFTGGGSVFLGGMANQSKVPIFDFQKDGKYSRDRQKTGDKFSSELFADSAIRIIQNHSGERPFMLYVAFTSPHDPRTPPPEYARLYDPAKMPVPKNFLPQHPFNNGEMTIRDEKLASWPRTPEIIRQHIAAYYGMISHLDAQIGRIIKALEDSGKARNTLIVFYGDHGLALGRHGLLGKQNLYEHTMTTPLIFAGPGIPAGKTTDAMCYLFDIFPTVCARCDVPVPKGIDGRSLNSVLAGTAKSHREAIFGAYREFQRSVRDERWKLIRYPHINESQLFDLQTDPDEMKNLAGDSAHAARLAAMTDLLQAQQKQFGDRQPLSTDKPAPRQVDLKP